MRALMDTGMDEFKPLTVEEYYRLWARKPESARDERTELINGVIFDMAPIGISHAGIVGELDDVLRKALGEQVKVRSQLPLRLGRLSEPQPDLMVLRPQEHHYRDVRPTAADALLVIEVSHSTYRRDRDIKIPLYAYHSIPEVWIVDLRRHQLQVFSSPERSEYRDVVVTGNPGVREISSLPGVPIDLSWFKGFPISPDE